MLLLRGRLGNQLFQYAAAVALHRASGREVYFHTHGGTGEELLLARLLGSDFRRPTTRQLLASGGWVPWHDSTVFERGFYRLFYRDRVRRSRYRSFFEEQSTAFAYDPAFTSLDRIRSLEGYFQHQSYWADVVDDVARALMGRLAGLVRPGVRSDCIGVHVRGLDYADYGWKLPLGYYRQALEYVADRTGVTRVAVFGDDPAAIGAALAECRVLGLEGLDCTTRVADASTAVLHDLSALAHCGHIICSNSTFAWWGAALGDQVRGDAERTVMVPDPWIAGFSVNLAREEWTRSPVLEWANDEPEAG